MSIQTDTNQPNSSQQQTTVGSYFVSNYPPFSFWESDRDDLVDKAINTPASTETPLGLYMHIPFCRKRCHFCYFRVYTDKKSAEIRNYIDTLQKEMSLYKDKPFLNGRTPSFIYFGGGTPSYLSVNQLRELVEGMSNLLSWENAREIAFECEPGTLSGEKLDVIKDLGITRLSLGIENFNDKILEYNGRAHRSPEIFNTYEHARNLGFQQINIDLIAGMIGETAENWQKNLDTTIELQPDIVTIYQMEVPYNTTIYKEMKEKGESIAPVADWETKRAWVKHAFETLENNGYEMTSAYTVVKKDIQCEFLYRDHLWSGADLLSLGVSSFSHINGTHFQNEKDFGPYINAVNENRLPIRRAMALDDEEKLIREFILQIKKGYIDSQYFEKKFHIDVLNRFDTPLQKLKQEKYIEIENNQINVNREGLLRIDSLLPNFYLEKHRGARYT
jgi:oxygen-independent coproporphyrinogen-3 oxidase